MYERSYGYRYKEAESGWAPEIAKLMRADIKQAVAEGLLPGAPVKYSVTSRTYSGGQSIDITVKGWTAVWVECPGGEGVCNHGRDPWYAAHHFLTADGESAKITLERIHDAYNHTGSETQTDYFDVRYYGHVQFEDPGTAAWKAEEAAKAKAKRAAVDQGKVLGKMVNYGREGTRTVHWLVETTEGKKALMCGARLWRGGTYSMVNADSTVTCSRCAKKGGA